MGRFLSRDEIVELTGRRAPGAQRRVLDRQGVPYYTRPDGHPIVVSEALHRATTAPAAPEPDWSALE